jgi:hypothetical protein
MKPRARPLWWCSRRAGGGALGIDEAGLNDDRDMLQELRATGAVGTLILALAYGRLTPAVL